MLITKLAVFAIDRKEQGSARLIELASGVTTEEVRAKTEAD